MTLAHGKLNITGDKISSIIAQYETVLLELVELPPLSKDIKTELFLYTLDKSTIKSANKFQCEDLDKKDTPYNKNNDLLILVSSKKSKDGKEFVGKTIADPTNNYIYLAYSDGKTATAPLREYAISMMHFIKCLIDHGINLLHVDFDDSDFADEVDVAITYLLVTSDINK